MTLLQKLSRYQPDRQTTELLSAAGEYTVRADREKRMLEITAAFDRIIDKDELYRIEGEIAAAYELNHVYLLPRYPASLFTDAYIHQVVKEAHRVGIVASGFFDIYTARRVGEGFELEIAFRQSGVELLCRADTPQVLSGIIRAEFGLEIPVKIVQSKNPDAVYEEFYAAQNQRIREINEQNIANARAAAEERRAREEANKPPADERDSFARVATLYENTPEMEQSPDGKRVQVGYMTFDLSDPQPFFGEPFAIDQLTPLCEAPENGRNLCFVGQVNSYESRETRGGDKLMMTIGITDNQSSINLKLSLDLEEGQTLEKKIQKSGRTVSRGISKVVTWYNLAVVVKGNVKYDKFDKESVMTPTAIQTVTKLERMDDAPEKRVELHMHTNLSSMDALTFPEQLVDTATRWGWDAIAVTDHGNVQAYPLLKDLVAKKDLKILYGMEAYYVDDRARAVYGDCHVTLAEDEICIFDIETTGLSAATCQITEIGAVLVKGGEVLATFNTFADPGCPIPAEIVKLTGITDEMVRGAPSQKEAVEAFLAFAGNRLLVAHNAGFDTGFIRKACEDHGLAFPNAYLDTVALSRYVNPDLKRHKLDTLAEYFKLGGFNHHRASDDAEMLSAIFFKMTDKLRSEGVYTVDEMNRAMSDKADPLKLKSYHMILLAKNMVGLKNLYKLISGSYLDCFHRVPRITRSALDELREGIIVGSACEAGELFAAILEGKAQAAVEEIASYYDYLEIQPICNNRFLIANGTVADDEGLRELNRKIVALGDKLGIPVCATCDSHFINREDEIFRKILLKGMKFADGDKDVGLYLRTTEEMLAEFAYLGEEKAYEVVVTNTRKIADSIERMKPIPDGSFTPKMDGAEEDLQRLCWERAADWYGFEGKIPEIVSARLERELKSIIENGFAVLYMIAQKLVWYSESQGYLVGSRGSVGSSFVASMAGISEVNPLPPHYRCPKCQWSRFVTDGSVGSGFDLPDDVCPECGEKLIVDGHDIPFETFLGFYGDKSPDIDLNFSGEVQGKVHKYTEELFGSENVFRAGTLGTLASKTAFGYVMKYLDEKHISVNKAEVNRLINGCVGVKRTTGQHPGGIVVIPKEYSIYDFTPVQHPADDPTSDIVTTHFPFAYLHDTILKLDELGHDMPTKYKWLEKYSGISVMDVPMNDPTIYELFQSVEPLGLRPGDIDCNVGTWGLPEFGTRFVQKMLEEAKPRNFADLLQISGLSHGTDVWTGNAQELIANGTCTISDVVGTRDSIMLTLIRYGVDNALSFKIMESVRKGKGLTPEWEAEMRAHEVPDWYIWSCKKIKYMFPKAHAAAYNMSAIRLAWFKIHRPMEFYAAFLTVAPGGFDASIVGRGRKAVKEAMDDIDKKTKEKTATAKDADTLTILQLVDESMARGVRYLPIDLYRSGSREYLPDEGKIRMPFNSLPGLGDAAAEKIVAARADGEFFSREDLQLRAGLSKSIMQLLADNHVLDNLSETNQITLF